MVTSQGEQRSVLPGGLHHRGMSLGASLAGPYVSLREPMFHGGGRHLPNEELIFCQQCWEVRGAERSVCSAGTLLCSLLHPPSPVKLVSANGSVLTCLRGRFGPCIFSWLLLKSEKQRLALVLSLLEPSASSWYQTWKNPMAAAEKPFPFPCLKIFSESSC